MTNQNITQGVWTRGLWYVKKGSNFTQLNGQEIFTTEVAVREEEGGVEMGSGNGRQRNYNKEDQKK